MTAHQMAHTLPVCEAASLAQDLHDGVAQSLSAVNLMLQALIEQADYPESQTRELLVKAHRTARTANAELRRVIDQLHMPKRSAAPVQAISQAASPTPLKPLSAGSQKLVAIDRLARLGLVAALMEYFKYATNDSTALVFDPDRYVQQALALEVELFRIAQEAVSNSVRHGQAKRICISLSVRENKVKLLIEDDGVGAQAHPQGGLGLASMRERTARLGGALNFGVTVNKGVSLQVLVPCQSVVPIASIATT